MSIAFKHPKPVIGLTGAPGSGKSFVAKLLVDRGGALVDADRLAKQALNEPDVIETLAQWWGDAVIDRDTDPAKPTVRRDQVAKIVFNQPEEKKRLESLIHPRVHEARRAIREKAWVDDTALFVIEDVPLLIETGLDQDCDAVLFIDVPLVIRQKRVWETRQWTAQELARREANQVPLDIKKQRADHVLSNAGQVSTVSRALDRILQTIMHGDAR